MLCACKIQGCDYTKLLRCLRNNISKAKKKNRQEKAARLGAEREKLKRAHAAKVKIAEELSFSSSSSSSRSASVERKRTANVTQGMRETQSISLTQRHEECEEHEQKNVDRVTIRTIEERPDGTRVTREEEKAREQSETKRHSQTTELKLTISSCRERYVETHVTEGMKLCFKDGPSYAEMDFIYRQHPVAELQKKGGFYEFVDLPWVDAAPLYRAKWDHTVQLAEREFPLPAGLCTEGLAANPLQRVALVQCLRNRGALIGKREPHLRALFEHTHDYMRGAHTLMDEEFEATKKLVLAGVTPQLHALVMNPDEVTMGNYSRWWRDFHEATFIKLVSRGLCPQTPAFQKEMKKVLVEYPSPDELKQARKAIFRLFELYPKDAECHALSGGYSPQTVQRIHDRVGSSESEYAHTGFLPVIESRVETAAQILQGNYTKLEFVVRGIHSQVRFIQTRGELPELKGLVPVVSQDRPIEMGLTSLVVDLAGEPREWQCSDRTDFHDFSYWLTVSFVGGREPLAIPMQLQYWAKYFRDHQGPTQYATLTSQTQKLMCKLFQSWTDPIHNLEATVRTVGFDENQEPITIPARVLFHPAYERCRLLADQVADEQKQMAALQKEAYAKKLAKMTR